MAMHKGILGQSEGGASVKKECCGNPLRGCMSCPPPKKLTFEEWLEHRYAAAHPSFISDMQECWKAAQENK